VEALKWYRKAAEQGDSDALYTLGWRYAKGKGVTKDYKEAIKWFRQAAIRYHLSASMSSSKTFSTPLSYITAKLF